MIKGKIVAYEPPTLTRGDEIMQVVRFNLPRIKNRSSLYTKSLQANTQTQNTLKTRQCDTLGFLH